MTVTEISASEGPSRYLVGRADEASGWPNHPGASSPPSAGCVARHIVHDCRRPGACGRALIEMLDGARPRTPIDGDPTPPHGIERRALPRNPNPTNRSTLMSSQATIPTDEAAASAALAFAEAVRHLNHLTIQPGALWPPEVYTVVQQIRTGIERLPQLLSQLERNLAQHAADTYSDRGDPDDVHAAQLALARARTPLASGTLINALDAATGYCAHLGYRPVR